MLLWWVLGNFRLRKQRKLKFETVPDEEQMEMAGDPFVVDVNDVNNYDENDDDSKSNNKEDNYSSYSFLGSGPERA